jgi:hypothetical protein
LKRGTDIVVLNFYSKEQTENREILLILNEIFSRQVCSRSRVASVVGEWAYVSPVVGEWAGIASVVGELARVAPMVGE